MSERVRLWLADEWPYQSSKFAAGADARATQSFGTDDDEWRHRLDMYYHRAKVQGLDLPNGRQALAKFVATAVAMLDSVIEEHGELPEPGVPSGEGCEL